ncbi:MULTISPECIES: RNA polymerase sigma factor [Chryseobacterium]|uniref:RNA polymerase sigma factor (Sigma-70 family) n=1 Tax=Chryseobacterium camelliae TaxID=1265445 RepID=A0ABU0TIP5_9FLAO|nr:MULTISPECIES: sigma-70 family RNA polymerase sigma factor [Chryseobacterium]MDT3409225.1 RNA polymerase sigma factor (sigma-70 family) [Pseudacidovorax intermedius]MDQ1096913.1 RNA polymerase sigma factor (sigma-70 family) [Chryseobacterium camelliae]MDQ1100855.1 RNA polymerase sigma factor (sigma-70 family) [Chryseobacterium sp. SORGH_AS_1048]MDR6084297.1 RNA polymerase sigma factor (sigma-70 family) [Chryseobacterium sp. SORGH_AS_0909]MDR6132568.1 RNA polymerase sigma factor (sigma-70 fam
MLLSADNDEFKQKYSFEEIFQIYNQLIFSLILRKVRERNHAIEITQEVFIHLWSYRKNLIPEKIEAIINKTCRQAISKFYKRLPGQGTTFYIEELNLYLPDESEEALEQKLKREFQLDQLHAAIETLPYKRKMILLANKIEGKTQKQIASEMNISRSAVENQIHKAIQFLKSKLTS